MSDAPADHAAEIRTLRADVAQLEQALLTVNDALFGLAGILGRVLVDAGAIERAALADAIEHRAGARNDPDHNSALLAFARAVRMNFPGGAFEVIEGGRSTDLDPA